MSDDMDQKRKDDFDPPKDLPSDRDRIDQIFEMVEESNYTVESWQYNFQRFSSKVIRFVTIIFIMSSISIAGFAYALNRVKQSRIEASYKACVARNKQNTGILFVFKKFQVTENDIIELFPITPDCHKAARAAVN